MDSTWLWNSHQRCKFLRAKVLCASGDILNLESCIAISSGFQNVFSTADTLLFRQNTRKTGKNAIEISQTFHDIAWFECFHRSKPV